MATRTREEWVALVEDYDSTDLEPHAWAKENGVPLPTIRAWRSRLLQEQLEGGSGSTDDGAPKAEEAGSTTETAGPSVETAPDWPALVARQGASGMSAKAWCEANGVDLDQFYYQRSKLRKRKAGKSAKTTKASKSGAPPNGDIGPMEDIDANTDLRLLRRVLEALAC